jgi:hypothetical protein
MAGIEVWERKICGGSRHPLQNSNADGSISERSDEPLDLN